MHPTLRLFRGILPALILLTVAVAPYGCKRSAFDGLQEGKVVYDVTFEGDAINPMVKAMLPSQITTYFGNNKTCMVIKTAMNLMETKMISDATGLTYTTLVAAGDKKMAMVLDKEQVDKNYLDRVDLKIVYTGEVKEIAGIQCKQAVVTDSTQNSYEVYFTDDLDLKTPNWSSPYRDIDGMLMEYSIKVAGVKINLKAAEVVNVKHEPGFFDVPKDYEIVTDPEKFRLGF